MKKIFPRHASRSFALISVLALVSLAALTATAFLASARLERAATRSIGSQTQLDMSLQAGAEMARFLIDNAFQDNYVPAIVTCFRSNLTNDLGYLWLGKPTNNPAVAPTVLFYPVFSHAGVTNLTLDGTTPFSCTNVSVAHQGVFSSTISSNMTALTNGFGTNALGSTYVRIPLVSASTSSPNDQDWSPAVGWITLRAKAHPTNTSNTPYARVAFFVQDMSGLVDAERMGGATNRSTGTNSEEISLTNVFGTSLINPSTVQNLTNNRRFLLSPGLLRQAAGLNTNDLRYVASGLRSSLVWSNLVPYGVAISSGSGYPAAGSSRQALNPLPSVQALTSYLETSLPFFTNRAGGFNPAAYCPALAANIIDYVDANNQPTFTNIGGVNIRGVEALPFVNERATFFNVVQTNASTNGFIITILTQDFYEFWNPANKSTLPVALSIVASNNLKFSLGSFDAPFAATNSSGQNVSQGVTTNSFTIPSISPNGFYVTNSLMVTNFFLSPGAFPPGFPLPYNQSQNFFSYKVYLGGVNTNNLYDQTLLGCYVSSSGVLPLNIDNTSAANRRFFGSYSAFAAQTPFNTFRTSVGDPRMMFYLNDNQDQITYATGSSFGGRNVRSGINANNNYYQVSIPFWPDGGHDSPAGNAAGTSFPNAVPLAAYTNAPPGRISDSGTLTNIFELGAIYDPIQWRDPTFKTASGFGSEANGGQWTILTTNATADNKYGGGNTLRIGRSEHPRFAFTNLGGSTSIPSPAMGTSAAALLDLFAVSNSVADNGGKINLNTAPGPVLAALAGGCRLTNDPALLPGGTNFSIPPGMATNAFVLGVQRFRARYPFYTPSQLGFISASTNSPTDWPKDAVFGNTNSITNSITGIATSMGITAWSDRAAEEWFAKMFGLSSTTSFNFRVYVVAQLLDSKGQPTSSFERRLYHIYCDYNSSGQLSTKQAGEYLY